MCDYGLPSQGDPAESVADRPSLVRITRKVLHVEAAPGAVVQPRVDGEVVAERLANPRGRVTVSGVRAGTYTLRQVLDGQPGLLTAPVGVG